MYLGGCDGADRPAGSVLLQGIQKTDHIFIQRNLLFIKGSPAEKPLTPPAQRIYAILENGAEAETGFLKAVSGLDGKAYREGFDFLLQNMYVTALRNGKPLNESWSTFLYAAAAEWEKRAPGPPPAENAEARLWEILSRTMTERQFRSLARRSPQPQKSPFQ